MYSVVKQFLVLLGDIDYRHLFKFPFILLLKSENKINEEEFTALSNLFDISNPSMLNYTNLIEAILLGFLMELHYTLRN